MQQPHLFKVESKKASIASTHSPKIKYKLTREEREILSQIPNRRLVSLDKIEERVGQTAMSILTNLSILEIYGIIKTENGKYRRAC